MKKNLWKNYSKHNCKQQTETVRLHFESGIDPVLREKFITLAKQLRRNYVFPVPVGIYIVNAEKITLRSGKSAYGSFRWYPKRSPIIKVAAAYEKSELEKYGKEELDSMILSSFIHELTHYYQYCSGAEQPEAVSEKQADYYRYRILEQLMSD